MKKAILGLFIALTFFVAAIPAATATSGPGVPVVPVGPPCPGFAIYTPATTMPLYVTAMQDTNALVAQLQELLAGMEDTSGYDQQIAVINEQIALAAQGSNYVHKKDLVLTAKTLLEQFLGTA